MIPFNYCIARAALVLSLREGSESPTLTLREHTESMARFCDCLVSSRQERDLAMAQIL
ncbi:hypothetical protein [uncultured Helicobacter sp.]|uniref:hypothetical protein n=1 Tax=uncultured Helicobacter sp. TaxID=175537 RepID=UPI00374F09AF